ncbi:MAG: MarR family transcriptional regulator [Chloroflexota bacterium]
MPMARLKAGAIDDLRAWLARDAASQRRPSLADRRQLAEELEASRASLPRGWDARGSPSIWGSGRSTSVGRRGHPRASGDGLDVAGPDGRRVGIGRRSRRASLQRIRSSSLLSSVGIEPPTLVRTIDRMTRDGLVERRPDPRDARAVRITLTQKAIDLRGPLMSAAQAVQAEAMVALGDGGGERLMADLRTPIGHFATEPE